MMIELMSSLCHEARALFERLTNPEYNEIVALAEQDGVLALAKIASLRQKGDLPAFLEEIESTLAPDGNYMSGLLEWHLSMVGGVSENKEASNG